MKTYGIGRKYSLLSCLALLVAFSSNADAAKGFLKIEAESSPDSAAIGSAVQIDCSFRNSSHFDTVESFMTVDVRFADGKTITLADSEPLGVLAPGDGFLFRGFVVVDDGTALGTAVSVCSAESSIVAGPRPVGQAGIDSDAATFGVFDFVEPSGD